MTAYLYKLTKYTEDGIVLEHNIFNTYGEARDEAHEALFKVSAPIPHRIELDLIEVATIHEALFIETTKGDNQ